ncbi:hypothetical protein [Sphingobium olei]|uniref:Hemerythrin-like domain-containing protein n=1 Tax=Sphingobium olei TaxID=420955 RepID=A0ABW3P1N7_9SPHN|nr:hypothetical protein [Sphingobium sp.]
MITELTQGHADLRVLMLDFARAMEGASPDDMPTLAQKRIAFSQLFRDHMAREEAMTSALPRADLPPEQEQVVRDHHRGIVALFLRYSEHVKCWTPAQIATDWPTYRKAVLALQDELRERMAWEEAHLHPLLGKDRRIAA